jgi:hypothetical protein
MEESRPGTRTGSLPATSFSRMRQPDTDPLSTECDDVLVHAECVRASSQCLGSHVIGRSYSVPIALALLVASLVALSLSHRSHRQPSPPNPPIFLVSLRRSPRNPKGSLKTKGHRRSVDLPVSWTGKSSSSRPYSSRSAPYP